MAWVPPSAGELRQRIRIERQAAQANDGGVVLSGAYTPLVERACSLSPTRGGETIIAGRLQASVAYDCWLRSDRLTATIRTADRAVDARLGTVFEVQAVLNPDALGIWLLLQLEQRTDG